jgi:hypothetical protein
MSLSISRVVVVSVFALSLNIATVPAAQAKPHEPGRATTSTSSRSLVNQAMEWMNMLLGRQMKNTTQSARKPYDGGGTTKGGPCIDPMGNPRPCP